MPNDTPAAPAAPATPPAAPASPPKPAAPPAPPAAPAAPPAAPAAPAAPVPPAASPPAGTPPATPPANDPPKDPNAPPPGDPPPAGRWADTWRDDMAKGNEKIRKMLDRYGSPEAVGEALSHARDTIAKGQQRQPPPGADATEEQVAEYRKANGVPETPDKYDTSLPEGLVIGDADKPVVDNFLQHAHGLHWSNDTVKQGLNWYFAEQQRQGEEQFNRDAQGKKAVLEDLHGEFGPQFKRYVRAADDLFAEAGPEFRDNLMQARMPDGTLVGANPKVVRWFINRALAENPLATIDPPGGSTSLQAAETELAGLIKESADRKGPYWKGPQAQAKQARHLELNRMLEKVPKKK